MNKTILNKMPAYFEIRVRAMTILLLLFAICTDAQEPVRTRIKTHFNGISISTSSARFIPFKLPYKMTPRRISTDTIFIKFEFYDVDVGDHQGAILNGKLFIRNYQQNDYWNEYQKVLDFNLTPGDSWGVRWLFAYGAATVTFQGKRWDDVARDTLYTFNVAGQGLMSHSDALTKIYATKKLGIVRTEGRIGEWGPEKWIFVSNKYIRKRHLLSYYKKGLLD